MTLQASRPRTGAASVEPAAGTPLPSLTGMRWAAAFVVFVYHVRNFGYFGGEDARIIDWAFGAGATGVSFFFILSGFVLAWSARGDGTRMFWRRRAARVYPVHLVTAAAALVLAFTLVPGLRPGGPVEAAANLLLVSSWNPQWWQALNPVSWSLVCEAFFYAVFPALYAGLRRMGPRALTVLVGACVLTVILLPWANSTFALDWSLYSFPLARFPEFVLGAAIGLLVRTGAWHGPGSEVSMGLTLIGYFGAHQLTGGTSYAAFTVIGLACLVPAAALNDLRGTGSPWRHRWLVRLGEWSFAFYMVHVLVMRTAEQLFGSRPELATKPALVFTAAVFGVSLALAWALYRWVEQPGRRWILPRRARGGGSPVR
ncbi:acyltransferase family protein [Streptomyces sp. NPDC051567]|uniref:acyltransferase family protein n=1 Tax=Streptomyces sp. NPDC051567 TaxID=3365660 RepID=UPI0037874B48